MTEPHRWTSEDIARMNRTETPEQRRRRAQAIRLGKMKDEAAWVRTCPYCQAVYCPVRYHYGKVRPNPRRQTCGEPLCQAQGRYAGVLGMKNYGVKPRLGGRPPVTVCKYGHPYDEKNTYIRKNGAKQCRTCQAAAERRRRRRRRVS